MSYDNHYGQLKLEDYERLGGSPYIEHDGRWYRVTDWHPIPGQGIIRYQATDCNVAEVEAWRESQKPPGPEPTPPAQPERPLLDPVLLAVERAGAEQGRAMPRGMRLYDWARTQPEFKGRGKVSNLLRERFRQLEEALEGDDE